MTPIRVAFVDDDAELREANAQTLELDGLEPLPLASAAEALARIDAGFEGVVVSDIRMAGMDGFQLFRRLHAMDADLPVILITGHGDIPMAVAAMKEGAYDFLAKPFEPGALLASIRRALEKRRLVLENRRLRECVAAGEDGALLLGETPAMQRLRRTLRHIADADVDVLVVGETGTGKEVVSSALHRWSRRTSRPFVALNCGALPETVIESELFGHEAGAFTGAHKRRVGRVEHSSGGTLFLDEIESMPHSLQVKLLRVLETREITPLGTNETRALDLRVVAASKIDLAEAASRGEFREDLFYRLNVVTLRLPPLRERRGDIPLLFAHFLARAAIRFRRPAPEMTPAVERHLLSHDWPGNVRELSHFAERVALGLEALEDPAPREEGDAFSLPERMERYEAALISRALEANGGDVRNTLALLGIPRKTFYDKLARHGIDRSRYIRQE
ncbi:sigma-54-dependent transcriptional regulator [Roseomonas marmotae]|uniref:Sigma-54-dependent Fis family transcriptional regulator n=1 Tax=Roseomonas marmotae TaxID=2768161 RepID=A0ABS3K8Z1_9PROT|nr:sigma-54 dependent transcriptional regulator [Roseomonas marmotae]MBO1073933.1 sigma-54-dependent Fis family transcriptional regulator [Roseomonas marmotae]QTI78453.1 sigma-54-dependent Fis family transcriptional regulator [Roseomonas marmotae]